jgi:hypothetical protein
MGPDFARKATSRIVRVMMGVLIFVPLAIFVFGEIVFHLWNWLMPGLFHLSALTSFWQAVGLMILSWLLFGGLRGLGGRGHRFRERWRARMDERWEHMTPEERDKFREWIRGRCGRSPAEAQPKP